MEYNVLAGYALIAFGIALVIIVGIGLLLKFSKKESPAWVGGIIIYVLLGSAAVMFIAGTILGWDSPV